MGKNRMLELTTNEIRDLKQNLDDRISKFFGEYQIDTEKPIDIFTLLNKCKFDVYYSKIKSFDGAILVDENTSTIDHFKSNKIVFVSSELSYEKSIFTLAHELAHYLVSKWQNPNQMVAIEFREHSVKGRRNDTENFIDFVAASILLPSNSFREELIRYGINTSLDVTDEIINAIAVLHNLEKETVRRRIVEVI